MKVLKVYQGNEEELVHFIERKQRDTNFLPEIYTKQKPFVVQLKRNETNNEILKIKKQNNFGKIEWSYWPVRISLKMPEVLQSIWIHILDEPQEKLNEHFLESLS